MWGTLTGSNEYITHCVFSIIYVTSETKLVKLYRIIEIGCYWRQCGLTPSWAKLNSMLNEPLKLSCNDPGGSIGQGILMGWRKLDPFRTHLSPATFRYLCTSNVKQAMMVQTHLLQRATQTSCQWSLYSPTRNGIILSFWAVGGRGIDIHAWYGQAWTVYHIRVISLETIVTAWRGKKTFTDKNEMDVTIYRKGTTKWLTPY